MVNELGFAFRVSGMGFRVAPHFKVTDRIKEPETQNAKPETVIVTAGILYITRIFKRGPGRRYAVKVIIASIN